MWIFLWIVVSCFILGIFGWSVRVLLLQKRAWKIFATKMNLSYQEQKGYLVSPRVNGSLGPFGFGVISEAQATDDSRGMRYVTVLEFALRQGVPGTTAAFGTKKMTAIIPDLIAQNPVSLNDPDWDVSWFIRATNVAIVEKYLTPDRVEVLKKIFRMKTLGALLIFNEEESILRLETADPLSDADRMEKIVRGVQAQLPVLLISDEERAAMKAMLSGQ